MLTQALKNYPPTIYHSSASPLPAYTPLYPHWFSSEDTVLINALHGCPSVHRAWVLEMPSSPYYPLWLPDPPGHLHSPDLSCLMRPLLALGSTGRKSLNQVISGSGLPLAAHSIVAVRVRSTTFSWGPMSMLGKPGGSWSSEGRDRKNGKGPVITRSPFQGRARGPGALDGSHITPFPQWNRGLWL